MATAFFNKPETTPEWREFYERLHVRSAAPLWEVLGDIVLRAPRPKCVPAHWQYEDLRPLIMESGRLITAEQAERRVLILENPGLPGESRITQSLYAGLQLVMPGEVTATHRHVAAALRFIIEGNGAYTAVDGERITMHPGDLILTPSWTYHDHGNPSQEPVVWLDGLDIPTVNMFDASFAEHHPAGTQPVSRSEGSSAVRYGQNLLPIEYKSSRASGPMLGYPYARSRETLERLYREGPVDQCHGVKLQYANPATGGYPLPTIAPFLQFLPAGFEGLRCRSTDATVFCVAEGSGSSRIGDSEFEWKVRDVFVAPSWYPISHRANKDSVLFSFSDRPSQKALGLWREQAPALD